VTRHFDVSPQRPLDVSVVLLVTVRSAGREPATFLEA